MSHPAHPRARSGRSGRSRRALFLVPALLTALLAPALPAAYAADQPPTAPTAPTAPSTAPTPAAEIPSAEAPATEAPQAPQAPAEDPAPEPTPTPTDTAEPCPALPLAPLGDPGDAVRQVTIEPGTTACFTVTVETPGTHRILIDGSHDTYPGLYAGEDRVTCDDSRYKDAWCDLAAGRYTLKLPNTDWQSAENRVALVPLMATAAGPCPAVPGTGYDTAPVTGTGVGPLGVVCHSFTAAPGERITQKLRRETYGDSFAWISDATGRRLCTERNQDGSEGCVLPEGTSGYRVHAVVGHQEDGSPAAPYSLEVRRLSDPAGCATVAPTVYGTAPDRSGAATGCKTFTPTVSGLHDVRAVDEDGNRGTVHVYAKDGTYACRSYDQPCALTAGTAYTVLTDEAVQILSRTSAEGCADGVTVGTTLRGTFSAPGEIDCLTLPLPQGAHLAVLSDRTTALTVHDATGAQRCSFSDGLPEGGCVLTGTAPFRLIVADGDTTEGGDGYGLVVHRTDAAVSCPEFTAGTFAAAPPRSVVRTGGGVFGGCLTIPAAAHSALELIEITRATRAEAVVVDAHGRVACKLETYDVYVSSSLCDLTPGLAHTVLVQGSDVPAETGLTRRDVTGTARGCVATPAVAVGGPSAAGTGASGATVCHQIRTASAGDTLHLNVRKAGNRTSFIVLDARGEVVCGYWDDGCVATGSTAYQMLIDMPLTAGSPVAYRIDAVRIGTLAGPAPECAKVANVSYGFGPLTGTLTEQRASLCWSLPTATGDRFDVAMSPAGTFETMPRPVLYPWDGKVDLCGGTYSDRGELYWCAMTREGSTKTARRSTLLMVLPDGPAQASMPVKAQFTCSDAVCGTDERDLKAVGPATVGRGKISMTVTGSALHSSAKVVVTNGSFRAESTTLAVAPDRRSMTVALDLTRAPIGSLSVSVFAFGVQYSKPSVQVVAALRNTAPASFTGTAVVGGKVTAKAGTWSLPVDSLAYQWRANGVAVAGATASAYTVPASLQGKSLSVSVVARKAGHPTLTSTSAAVAVKGVAPKATRAPVMTGAVKVGARVSVSVGSWSPAASSYGYQWRANGVAISGATGSAYTPTAAVRGKKLTVTVTAHRTGHLSGSATTAGVTVAYGVAPKATKAPYLTGTVRVGRTLTLNRGTWTPSPTSYAYQWYANGRAVSGATKSTFVPGKAQRGQKITVRVTAHRTGHTSGYAWTRATGAVAG
ncbi:hypothetical protein [Streptomyces sp. NPDC004435]|uniref:hypothetical protein n=1 Tax=Streptomyces sp. NPDC004435 TaxID=3364701 RepID=UPI0036D17E3A